MAAKKVKRAVAARKIVSAETAEAGGARVFPLAVLRAALRAALGTEVDRVRKYGGYTLILRRGRAVAAVIPPRGVREAHDAGPEREGRERQEEHERSQCSRS